ncbi:MAG TPA: hypothetical protein VKB81_19125 [Nitrospira sp.]|nr:hypothetical protein [Nitrospira sp.]
MSVERFDQIGMDTERDSLGQIRYLIPSSHHDETSLLTQRCAALAGGNFSSFTVAGRESLPAEPGSWLNSPLASATAELVGSTTTEPDTPTSLSEPTEEMPILSLRRIAPPGFLTQSFAVDGSGCTS